MTRKSIRIFLGMLPVFIGLGTLPLTAGGPFLVTGPLSPQQGQPYRWEGNSIQYNTDQGGLGNQTNGEANQLVADAFLLWENVDTADLGFQRAGALDSDITADNYLQYEDSISNCGNTGWPDASVIYDLDGSIIASLGYDNNSVLGFASPVCANHTTGIFTRGLSLLNGRFIDGQLNTPSHHSISLDDFRSAFVHEFGHLIGLGHSQINLRCLTTINCTSDEYAIPVMFPILLSPPQISLTTDDLASVSMLYPSSSLGTNTGMIQGRVVFSDGRTPAQGYNVIARNVSDPSITAVSSVSGYLFTAGAGNALAPDYGTLSVFGSRDTELIGYYAIVGLPPGEYTVEVEPINNSGPYPFIYESSVGPIGDIGFQYNMPGRCTLQYLHSPSSPDDHCMDQTILTVGAGQVLDTNTDIIFLGTPPRYDAWEDGP